MTKEAEPDGSAPFFPLIPRLLEGFPKISWTCDKNNLHFLEIFVIMVNLSRREAHRLGHT